MLSLLYLGVKAQQCSISSTCMFLDKKTLFKIWLNPGLSLTIFRETVPRLLLRMHGTYVASFVWTFIKMSGINQRNLLTHVLDIYHVVKVMQSTALEQKRFDLRLLSPAFRHLRLFLVVCFIMLCRVLFKVLVNLQKAWRLAPGVCLDTP